jgi:hypothetical protein
MPVKKKTPKKRPICARCEEPISGVSVIQTGSPYAGKPTCMECDHDLSTGSVPDEPEEP